MSSKRNGTDLASNVKKRVRSTTIYPTPKVRAPPISMLYQHALESILGFVETLGEMSIVMQVSKRWNQAARTMKPLQIVFTWDSSRPALTNCLVSSIQRHVIAIHANCYVSGEYMGPGMAMDPLTLCYLQRAESLRILTCCIRLDSPFSFPFQLSKLVLSIMDPHNPIRFQSFLDLISTELTVLRDLRLMIGSVADIDFSRLHAKQLQRFELNPANGFKSDAQINMFRSDYYSKLDYLNLEPLTSAQFSRLVSEPHSIQWKRLTLPYQYPSTEDEATHLTRLASTVIHLTTANCDTIDWIPSMWRLKRLDFSHVENIPNDKVVGVLIRLHGLQRLNVQGSNLNGACMGRILSNLPHLHTLVLEHLPQLETYTFFATCPLAQKNLRSLVINECLHPALRAKNNIKNGLLHLSQLTHLGLWTAFGIDTDPTFDAYIHLLTPPTRLFPHLKTFECA
jgi:hypothetical protein